MGKGTIINCKCGIKCPVEFCGILEDETFVCANCYSNGLLDIISKLKREAKSQNDTPKACDLSVVSCRLKYLKECEKNKDIMPLDNVTKSLGFKNTVELYNKLGYYKKLITVPNVKTVVYWLYSNGYDVTNTNGNVRW